MVRFQVRVIDKRSGEPLENVSITVLDSPINTKTDESGALHASRSVRRNVRRIILASGLCRNHRSNQCNC